MESLIMQQLRPVSALFSAVLLATILGCAATSTREGTGEYIDDTAITAKVKTAMLNAPGLNSGDINVETFKAVVQLRGSVNSQAQMAQAVQVAQGVGGVKSVKNDMRLK
jgi:osmotically-inducible protein OsmY